jgi:hypothetical protein
MFSTIIKAFVVIKVVKTVKIEMKFHNCKVKWWNGEEQEAERERATGVLAFNTNSSVCVPIGVIHVQGYWIHVNDSTFLFIIDITVPAKLDHISLPHPMRIPFL